MKQMKCLDCKQIFKAETSDEMMMTMMPHYLTKHKEMMEGKSKETGEEWVKRFKKSWKEAKEI